MKKYMAFIAILMGTVSSPIQSNYNYTFKLPLPTCQGLGNSLVNMGKVGLKVAELDAHFLLDHPYIALATNIAAFYGASCLLDYLKNKYKTAKECTSALAKGASMFGLGILATLTYQQLRKTIV